MLQMGVPGSGGLRAVAAHAAVLLGLLLAGCDALPVGGDLPTATPAAVPTVDRLPQEVRDTRPAPTSLPPTPAVITPAPQTVLPPASPRRFSVVIPSTATPSPTRTSTLAPTSTASRTPTFSASGAPGAPTPAPGAPGAPTEPPGGPTPQPTVPGGGPASQATATRAAGMPLPTRTPLPPPIPTPMGVPTTPPLAVPATATPTSTPGGPTPTPTITPTPFPLFTPLPTRTPRPTSTHSPTPRTSPTLTPTPPGPRPIGQPPNYWQFVTDVNAALDLLQTRSSTDYTMVRERLRDIYEVVPPLENERVWYVQVSTKTVWLSRGKMYEWGDTNLATWTAGVLLHLAFHVDLYDQLMEYDSCEAELRALERQRAFLARVSAPTTMLLALDSLILENNCHAEPAPGHAVP